MKSEIDLLEEVMAKKYKMILELEAYIEQILPKEGVVGSLGIGLETLANAQVQLGRVKAEYGTLEQKRSLLKPNEAHEVISGTKEEVLRALQEIESDNNTFKLIVLTGKDNSSKES